MPQVEQLTATQRNFVLAIYEVFNNGNSKVEGVEVSGVVQFIGVDDSEAKAEEICKLIKLFEIKSVVTGVAMSRGIVDFKVKIAQEDVASMLLQMKVLIEPIQRMNEEARERRASQTPSPTLMQTTTPSIDNTLPIKYDFCKAFNASPAATTIKFATYMQGDFRRSISDTFKIESSLISFQNANSRVDYDTYTVDLSTMTEMQRSSVRNIVEKVAAQAEKEIQLDRERSISRGSSTSISSFSTPALAVTPGQSLEGERVSFMRKVSEIALKQLNAGSKTVKFTTVEDSRAELIASTLGIDRSLVSYKQGELCRAPFACTINLTGMSDAQIDGIKARVSTSAMPVSPFFGSNSSAMYQPAPSASAPLPFAGQPSGATPSPTLMDIPMSGTPGMGK